MSLSARIASIWSRRGVRLALPIVVGSSVGWILAGLFFESMNRASGALPRIPDADQSTTTPAQPASPSLTGLWAALKDSTINSPTNLRKAATTVEQSQVADGTTPFERALKQLLDFDPKLAAEMYRMQDQLFSNVNVLACGGKEARMQDGGTFVLNGMALLDIKCAAGSCRVADLRLASEGNRSSVGSRDFESCFRKAAGEPFRCPDCRDGDVAVQWPLRHGFGHMSDDEVRALLDPPER